MCPAAVSAAALWLLALLGSGLTPAQASGFPHCSHSFYRQSPPQGSYDGQALCHTRPGGQTFATLYQPICGSAVYSAFHLSNGPAASTAEGGAGPESKEEGAVEVVVPALLKGDSEEPELSPAASHLQQWDSTVTTLVQTRVLPQCQTSGGDLYVLIGAGRLSALGHEAELCQTKLLWAAACCATPGGEDGSSVAFIRDGEEEERQVSVTELEDVLGVTELFSEACGRSSGADLAMASQSKAQTVSSEASKASEASEAAPAQNAQTEELTAANGETEWNSKQTEGSTEQSVASAVTESAKRAQVSPDGEESEVTSSESASPSESSDTRTAADPPVSSETAEEQEEDANSTSTFLYVLSTALYVLKAPLRPVVSTITELPGKVSYVLQEDLGVLCALPGDTYSVFHLLISDVFSWVGSAFDLVYGVCEACFSRVYYVVSSMGGALVDSCCVGVTGIGTLAGDTLGIFGDVAGNSWWATKFFGRRLARQSGDYVVTVVGELGGQASAVGKGFGKLAWKSGKGVGNVFVIGWRIGTGVLDVVVNGFAGDAYEERSAETFDLVAAVLPEKSD
ncbi:uncharacterized protein [Eucyclogobius newberryi]|uniref:uncharacterized protein n=1 Tax=Eucyclogobius newberryi TaxID=166745 RepID=UPI003B5C4A1D